MPNVLVLSFEGFSFSARQLYQQLLPKLLSRASVHESLAIPDALNYINTGWPSIILITDAVIAAEHPDSKRLLDAVVEYTKHGCTTVTMGFFAGTIDPDRLNYILKDHFDLRWQVAEYSKHDVTLCRPDEYLIRTSSLGTSLATKAWFLRRVPNFQTIYMASAAGTTLAYAAFGRVGLGKYGYIGDVSFEEEAEQAILAMCHLDRPEDSVE